VKKLHLPTVLTFLVFVFGLAILDLSAATSEISISERRKLAQVPEFSTERLFDGRFAVGYAAFLQDQVAFRDDFRGIKSWMERRLFLKREINGVYVVNNDIYDKFYGIDQRYIDRAATLISHIAELIDSDRQYLAVIPSKAHMLDRTKYLLSDQNAIAETLTQNTAVPYIDLMHLFEEPQPNLYYVTDHHWTTEGAIRAYQTLVQAMGYEPVTDYHFEEVTDSFVGSLYGRAAMWSIPKDRIYLAHNEALDGMAICRYATLDAVECSDSVYFREKVSGLDPYDVFIGGAAPIVVIENAKAPTDDELIVFKDSYSHALAPFLAQHFRKVTLFDLRYVRKEVIFDNFDLNGKVVLFLYSTTILNTDPQILN